MVERLLMPRAQFLFDADTGRYSLTVAPQDCGLKDGRKRMKLLEFLDVFGFSGDLFVGGGGGIRQAQIYGRFRPSATLVPPFSPPGRSCRGVMFIIDPRHYPTRAYGQARRCRDRRAFKPSARRSCPLHGIPDHATSNSLKASCSLQIWPLFNREHRGWDLPGFPSRGGGRHGNAAATSRCGGIRQAPYRQLAG
jgi:hypothetical protein